VLYDLNSIPVSALERVEILQDGASAVYGSDAIAGVINFILKSNYDGAEISARAGGNDDRRFRKEGVTGVYGHGNLDTDGYSFTISADLNQRHRTARRDATDVEYEQAQIMNGRFKSDFSSTASQYPIYFKETKPGSKSFGVTLATAPTNMQFNLGCPTSQQITGGAKDGILPTSTTYGRTFCNYNADQFLEAQGKGRDANVLSHGELKLGQNVTGFADLAYSRSERDFTGAPIAIGTGSTTNFTASGVGTPFQAILPIGHPNNPFTDARGSINYRFVNLRGGSSTINEGTRALAGIRGSNFGWDWESAVLWNRADNTDTTYGRLYLPTLRKLVDNNWSLAQVAADPTIGHDVVTKNMSQIAQWDAKVTREFGQLPGGAIGVAAGVEVRRESVKLNPDPLVASGQIFGLANTILDSSRAIKSAFAEMRTPLLKNLELDFAGRVDKYPGLKSNFVPKIGGKWTLSDKFAIRGTYAEGFRAPALSQIVPGGAQYFQSGIWDPKRCETDLATPKPGGATTQDCAKSIAGTGGFNPDLKPETSKTYNLGFIFSPTSSFDVTLDLYKIKRENEITVGSTSEALKNEDRAPQNVLRDTNPASFLVDASGKPIPGTGPLLMVATPWTNQGMTQLTGADIEGRLRSKLGAWGSLSTTLRATYVKSYEIQANVGDPVNNVVGSYPYITDWNLSNGSPTPRWKSSISTTWKQADHAVNLSVNYVGAVTLMRIYDGATKYAKPFCYYGTKPPGGDAAPDRNTSNLLYEQYYPQCSVKEFVTVGLGYTFTGFKHWTLNANIQNLLDTPAPYNPLYGTTTAYDSALHSPTGRYFNVSGRYVF
jgi:iron complex outermembrane receptor protein